MEASRPHSTIMASSGISLASRAYLARTSLLLRRPRLRRLDLDLVALLPLLPPLLEASRVNDAHAAAVAGLVGEARLGEL